MLLNPFAQLDDQGLEQSLMTFTRNEREGGADIILHLLEVKARKIYVARGYTSLFEYCTGKLGFSKNTAYRRKAVVEKIEEFPEVLERLRGGRLHLCAAAAVARHLEEGSATELLDAVEGMSHRDVETFLVKVWRAKVEPLEDVSVGCVSIPKSETGLKFEWESTPGGADVAIPDGQAAEDDKTPSRETTRAGVAASASRKLRQRTVVKPLPGDANRVSVTLSDKTLASMQRLKEILGGKTDDEIFGRALESLLDKVAPERRVARRMARAGTKPKTAPQKPVEKKAPRRGRLADRDAVMVASDCRCTFTSDDGTVCGAKFFLEIDHIKPWALGGTSDAYNLQPHCTPHNAYRAEKTFGRRWAASIPVAQNK